MTGSCDILFIMFSYCICRPVSITIQCLDISIKVVKVVYFHYFSCASPNWSVTFINDLPKIFDEHDDQVQLQLDNTLISSLYYMQMI